MMKKIFSSCIVYFIAGALYPGIGPGIFVGITPTRNFIKSFSPNYFHLGAAIWWGGHGNLID
jgi:hypothetical protein